jgi:hypothetical protein
VPRPKPQPIGRGSARSPSSGRDSAAYARVARARSNLAPVLVDQVQIQWVVLNLVRTAVEAMEQVERRKLTIGTRAIPEAGMAEVVVADTSPGIAPEWVDRLFQPFVTTKATGMGWVFRSAARSLKPSRAVDYSAEILGWHCVLHDLTDRKPGGDGGCPVSGVSTLSMTRRCVTPFQCCSSAKPMR